MPRIMPKLGPPSSDEGAGTAAGATVGVGVRLEEVELEVDVDVDVDVDEDVEVVEVVEVVLVELVVLVDDAFGTLSVDEPITTVSGHERVAMSVTVEEGKMEVRRPLARERRDSI